VASLQTKVATRERLAAEIRSRILLGEWLFKENLSNFWRTIGILIVKVLYDEFRKMAITGLLISSKT
jgi:hypothetical protein